MELEEFEQYLKDEKGQKVLKVTRRVKKKEFEQLNYLIIHF